VLDRSIVSVASGTAVAGCCGNFCSGHPLDSKLSEGSGGWEIVLQRKKSEVVCIRTWNNSGSGSSSGCNFSGSSNLCCITDELVNPVRARLWFYEPPAIHSVPLQFEHTVCVCVCFYNSKRRISLFNEDCVFCKVKCKFLNIILPNFMLQMVKIIYTN